MSEFYNENGKVICQECKKPFSIISPTHLKNSHNLTIEEYRKKYNDPPLSSDGFKAKQRFKGSVVFKDNVGKSEEELFSELAPKPEVLMNIQNDTQLEELKKDQEGKSLQVLIPNGSKREIYSYLLTIFPNLKSNFQIDIKTPGGYTTYSTISDLCDPVDKVDFEFTKEGWHNENRAVNNVVRDKNLTQNGWKVYRFDHASLYEIKKLF